MERHRQQYRGVYIPAEVMTLATNGTIGAGDVLLLAIIGSLVTPDQGCYASNTYLAARTGKSERQTRRAISKLKKLGLLHQVGFNGARRLLETTWNRVAVSDGYGQAGWPDMARQDGQIWPGTDKATSKVPLSVSALTDVKGFDLAPLPTTPTTRDNHMASILEEAVNKLPARRTGIERARPSTWPRHFHLLRTRDGINEDDIAKVLAWYTSVIGREFVPEVYSGSSFRRKYTQLERAYERDVAARIEVGPEADNIARRLAMLSWPGGSAEEVPATTQASLDAYLQWCHRRDHIVDRLERDDVVRDYGRERLKLWKLGKHLIRTMPPPTHFVEEWMRNANRQVCGRDKWQAGLNAYAFNPEAKRFRDMGRGWASNFANDPDRWDRFHEVMKNEED